MTKLEQLLKEVASRSLKPKPKLSLVEWADTYRRLSQESSASPGRWRTISTPYMIEPMNAISNDNIRKVVLMISSQLGKSEFLLNLMGYFAHQSPSPCLYISPTEFSSSSFSKERVMPMIRDTPVLNEIFNSTLYKDSTNTILYRSYPGGFVAMAGANSPTALAGRPIKVLLLDEVDRYPDSAKSEGNPVNIVQRRSQNFHDSKFVAVSTPVIEETSKIYELFLDGDQRFWEIECVHCQTHFYPEWKHVSWNEPKDAMLVCPHCGGLHNDNERLVASQNGKYVARNPGHRTPTFHTNALVSRWVTLEQLVHEFVACNNEQAKLQPFQNTVLGWPSRNTGQEVGDLSVSQRGLEYDHTHIPNDVIILTCGADVQIDRIEYEVLGHTAEGQTYSIYYGVVPGDTRDLDTFRDFKKEINERLYVRLDGIKLDVVVTLIDSGFQTKTVYKFCDESKVERIYASKGIGGPRTMVTLSKSSFGATFYRLGVDIFKEQLYNNLQLTDETKVGYCFFPKGRDQEYFIQLCQSETRTSVVDNRGQRYWHYEKKNKNQANEALDCRIYAMAAYEIIRPVAKKNAEYNIKKQLNSAQLLEKEPEIDQIQKTINSPINPPKIVERPSKYGGWNNLKAAA